MLPLSRRNMEQNRFQACFGSSSSQLLQKRMQDLLGGTHSSLNGVSTYIINRVEHIIRYEIPEYSNYLQVAPFVTIDTSHEPKQVFHMITTAYRACTKNKTNLAFTVSHPFNRRDVCQGGVSIQRVIWGSDRLC